MRASRLIVLLLAPLARADPQVLLAPSVGTPLQVTLSGRVLKHAPSKGSSKLSKNLRLLTSSNWEGADVEVRVLGQSASATSGHDGNFEVTLKASPDAGFPAMLTTAEAHVKGVETAVASVDVISDDAPFFVVSDFDDTIAVTNVVKTQALIEAALLKDEETQPVVEGMPEFYGCLREQPVRPVFALVSGSPIQYLGRISRFLAKHAFPVMGLYLRDIGPNTLSNYKQPVIRQLLSTLKQKAVLVGDSGEHDPEVYREMRDAFPGRVAAIYIRNAGHAENPKRFEGMLLFTEPKQAALDAVKRGLASKSCVAQAFPEEKKP